MSEPFAAGQKRPGEPWRVAATSSRASRFDPSHFALTVPCIGCSEPLHVEAACIEGVVIVSVGACRRCSVDGNVLIEHARRAAERVLRERGVIDGAPSRNSEVSRAIGRSSCTANGERSLRFTERCPQCDRPLDVGATITATGILVEIPPCRCGFDPSVEHFDIARQRAAMLFVDGAR